jgi:hypothetical protein
MTARRATSEDAGFLRRMLFDAWQWESGRDRPDYDDLLAANPDLENPYIDRFGVHDGDVGFIAERDGVSVGAAWYRLFT